MTSLHRGRLPAKPLAERYAIKYVHEYLATPLPAPSYPVDVSSGITYWGMLGNDRYGDCTFAGKVHYDYATAAAGQVPFTLPTADAVVSDYLEYTGGKDVGANMADLLLYFYRTGKIVAFAPVDHTDRLAMDAAMAAFHGLYVGVQLTNDADEKFRLAEPWQLGPGETPNPDDGHCIVKVRALEEPTPDTVSDYWVTWGKVQASTGAWSAACVEEAWVIVTEEDAQAASLNLPALLADIEALHGTGPSVPPPAPPVTPAPAGSGARTYSPPVTCEPVVADLACPSGGAWLVAADGSIYAFGGAPFAGSACGAPYFSGRTATRLDAPNNAEAAAGKKYVIVDAANERYAYPLAPGEHEGLLERAVAWIENEVHHDA